MQGPEVDMELDCKNMSCPMPVIKTKLAIDTLNIGQLLRIYATDPGSCTDIPAWAESLDHELVFQGEEDGAFVFVVKKTN
ncbi:MAG: sulfurtransferase TusA family protein [Candidatus Kariarchaeaceae archaeon]|jgi:tRNA 2-thiouridine synthesizing protein A